MRNTALGLIVFLAAIVSANVYAIDNDKLVSKGESLFDSKCNYCHGAGLQQRVLLGILWVEVEFSTVEQN